MKICVTASGSGSKAKMDPRFGRCPYFAFIDTETMASETVPNPNAQASGGAGISSGQLVSEKKAEVVITGNIGPNAFRTLDTAGIEVITGVSGTVEAVVEKYKQGQLSSVDRPSVDSKFGMGR